MLASAAISCEAFCGRTRYSLSAQIPNNDGDVAYFGAGKNRKKERKKERSGINRRLSVLLKCLCGLGYDRAGQYPKEKC